MAVFSAWLGAALLAPPMVGQGAASHCIEACAPAVADTEQLATSPPDKAAVAAQAAPVAPVAVEQGAATPQGAGVASEPARSDLAQPQTVTPETVTPEEEHILVSARRHVAYDPLEKANRVSYEAVQAVDRAVVAPLADRYEHIVPEPARDGIHNMVHNLREPYIAINFLLQHRVGKSAETVARFIINSTVGVAGLFDMAKRKPIHLPRRPNGFADTMAFYGVHSGPYLFLPLVGPTTIRDLLGNTLDRLVIPLSFGRLARNPAYGAPLVVFGAMDRRLKNNGRIERTRAAANPYAAMREDYMLRRREEIEGLHYHRPRKEHAVPVPDGAVAP